MAERDFVIPAYFHRAQLAFKPRYEWAFGERLDHPETTARAESILTALEEHPRDFELFAPQEIPLAQLRRLHNYNLLTLYNTAGQLPEGETFFPNVFPKEKMGRGDPTNLHQAGAFCFDAGTPLDRHTWTAAAWSAACALSAATAVRKGVAPMTYALSRPPGHHATKDLFGGYCYFNNAAIAAKYLRRHGRVAVLDIDFHHGNGTQSIFYRDGRVLTVSVHADPRDYFPFFLGYSTETGTGAGAGYNLNIPIEAHVGGKRYIEVFRRHVIPALRHFDPAYLVLSAGFDEYEKDPVGHFGLRTDDYEAIGQLVGRLHLPTAVIQEGGYYTAHLGQNAAALLLGIRTGLGKRRV